MGVDSLFADSVILSCDCGCSKLELGQFTKELGGTVHISHYYDSFYSEQTGIFNILKDRLVMCWKIMCGKKYTFYEVLLTKNETDKFMSFINNIDLEIIE